MNMFGFDEPYTMFDVTPVDNQFILEYLPTAGGDAVRVYLYGLMQCYHPQSSMSMEQMARELRLTEDEVQAAYRHWERKGLVKRTKDNPPQYRYVAVKQKVFIGGAAAPDPEYEAFAQALYGVFGNDRRLHGGEISQCYEWVEELKLPPEVVIALMAHMVKVHGKGVSIKSAEKLALQLADEQAKTPEDAQVVLGREKAIWDGSRAVVRRFGKRRTPSEDEQAMYRKWLVDWGFTQDAILAACAETTKGEPTFAYLDGILNGIRLRRRGEKNAPMTGQAVAQQFQAEQADIAPLKALLAVLKVRGVSVNDGTLAVYQEMRALYPDAIILMAGQECARHGLGLDDVTRTLQSWKRNGLRTTEDVRRFMKQVNEQNEFLSALYELLGVEAKPNAADRRLVQKWQEEWGMEVAFILSCAPWAAGKDRPIPYLDGMLSSFHSKGISTMEAAVAERSAYQAQQGQRGASAATAPRPGKVVGEQQYTQRTYTHSEDALDAMMAKWKEAQQNDA